MECATLFPFPSRQRSVSHPKTRNNKRLVLQICHMAAPRWERLFSLSSGSESPDSPNPPRTADMRNMHPSVVLITCGRKPPRLMPMC